ncbi:MAG: hypothetical protein ABI548_27930 [Polyangiaceae bacterium]
MPHRWRHQKVDGKGDIAKAKGDIAKANGDIAKANSGQAQADRDSESANVSKAATSAAAATSIDAARPLANWSSFGARLNAKGGRAAIDSLARAALPPTTTADGAVSSTPTDTKITPEFCVFRSLQSRAEPKHR